MPNAHCKMRNVQNMREYKGILGAFPLRTATPRPIICTRVAHRAVTLSLGEALPGSKPPAPLTRVATRTWKRTYVDR
jgi:hypothetical protein